jgi:periplasmic protein TonB
MTKKTRTAMKHGLIVSCILASFAMTSRMVAQGAGSALGQNPSTGPNTVYRVAGDVSAPFLIHSVDQEYTEAARNARISGLVLVHLIVDTNGNPSHVRVVRGLGMGLDEKAIQAVQQYKFKPGMKNGKPVRVELTISLNFNETAN